MQWLNELPFADNRVLQIGFLLACGIAALIVLALLYRLAFAHRLRVPGGRTRQPRLGLVDAFSLDGQRQLVLVRRDNVEHLVMIGGPNDVLVKSQINRAAVPTRETTQASPLLVPSAPATAGPAPRIGCRRGAGACRRQSPCFPAPTGCCACGPEGACAARPAIRACCHPGVRSGFGPGVRARPNFGASAQTNRARTATRDCLSAAPNASSGAGAASAGEFTGPASSGAAPRASGDAPSDRPHQCGPEPGDCSCAGTDCPERRRQSAGDICRRARDAAPYRETRASKS